MVIIVPGCLGKHSSLCECKVKSKLSAAIEICMGRPYIHPGVGRRTSVKAIEVVCTLSQS